MNQLFAFALVILAIISLLFVLYKKFQKKESFVFNSDRPAGFQMINSGAPLTETYSPCMFGGCHRP